MVATALATHPDAEFWMIRTNDTGSGAWLSSTFSSLPDTIKRLDTTQYTSCATILNSTHIYTVSASEGMYALLADKSVHVFGRPYYAGWGLTQDAKTQYRRTNRPTLNAFFEIVFLRLSQYLDPATHSMGDLDPLLDYIELQRSVANRYRHLRKVVGLKFQLWKRPFATPFLTAGGGTIRWSLNCDDVHGGEHIALWGGRSAANLPPDTPFVRMEDGFIHSTGLGSDLTPPRSQVVDLNGIYFDATRPSDLTAILNDSDFDAAELQRASSLRTKIVHLGLTKYNLGRRRPEWRAPTGQTVILVPGQVADDASIRLGTGPIKATDELLREVRLRNPHAFIVYKPHPDVLSGNRMGLIDATAFADVVDTNSDLISLIDATDEVHTLSSLAGFDALLRRKAVYTYGYPFYAGWGLTHDMLLQPWRKRTLTLDMLTAGALLRYPVYWDWTLRIFTTPESIADQIAEAANRPLSEVRKHHGRMIPKARRWLRNIVLHAIWLRTTANLMRKQKISKI
ncbi:capsular biosynthesis protein [Burkholderia cenocepacia]